MPADTYRARALDQAPRILGFGDRDASSPTAGCFDRNYWHYRILDFPNARYQETALLLALLAGMPTDIAPLCGASRMRGWAESAIRYWGRIQRRDGSFDEVYPFEHSFVATAFSTQAIGEAMGALGLPVDGGPLEKAARWLSRNENTDLANQMAGAMAALEQVHRLTGRKDFGEAAAKKKEKLLSLQSEEGWFVEYGGWDLGYLSICLSYMGSYVALTNDIEVRMAMSRAAAFVRTKLDENGGYDYRGSSRQTQYLYPFGFAVLGDRTVLGRHLNGLVANRIPQPSWLDDRFCIPMTIDYLKTWKFLHNTGLEPCE